MTDPNIHSNTDHKLNGNNTGSKGSATWSELAIGKDGNNLPDWRIALDAPAHTYQHGDLSESFAADRYQFRITAVVSVSDVKPKVDAGSSGSLMALLLGLLLLVRRQRHPG